MDIILITLISITFLLQVFFFFKLAQLMTELDQLHEETEMLNMQYFELHKLITEQLKQYV